MQSKNKYDGIQLSSRYLQYCFAKRYFRDEPPREILPFKGEASGDTQQDDSAVIYDDYNSKFRKDGNTCSLTLNCGAKADRNGMKLLQDKRVRRLTPLECERLQAFPDYHTKYGIYDGEVKEVSDSQRYKVLGNAVTVKVVEEVLKSVHTNH